MKPLQYSKIRSKALNKANQQIGLHISTPEEYSNFVDVDNIKDSDSEVYMPQLYDLLYARTTSIGKIFIGTCNQGTVQATNEHLNKEDWDKMVSAFGATTDMANKR